jgi:hypothetical protein
MNFRKATDALLESVTLEDLADAMGVSVQALRQARAAEGTASHRSPPPQWQAAVRKLALRAAARNSRLATQLENS